jgi:hypothetical protein
MLLTGSAPDRPVLAARAEQAFDVIDQLPESGVPLIDQR